MNYRLIKIGYQVFGTLGLCLSVLLLIFVDECIAIAPQGAFTVVYCGVMIPFFVLKIIHDKKDPSESIHKLMSIAITIIGSLGIVFFTCV